MACHYLFTVDETEDTLRVQNNEESENEDLQLPFFDLAVIAKATDGFSINNKLGEGGFGAVYRVG